MSKTIWAPQPRQAAFMSRWEYEALYGGAAGSGKSDAMVCEALRQVHIPHYKALILRKTFPQLGELIEKSFKYYKPSHPKAKFNQSSHCWTFPSGAKIQFGSMQHTSDRHKYQGAAYDMIGFDETTHFTWDEYSYMFSRNRPNGPGTRVYIRGATNPGGIGHMWVKNRYITAGPPMKTIWTELPDVDENGNYVLRYRSRIFVPARLADNKKLTENDPNYRSNLLLLPENERKALLDGNWDVFGGQYFTEWQNNPTYLGMDGKEHPTRINTHVIHPIERIPAHWRIYCGLDWGSRKPFSVHWYGVDEDGRMYCFKEFYGCADPVKSPDVGIKMDFVTLGREILRLEKEDDNINGKRITRIADPAIFQEDGGESMAQVYDRIGLYFDKGDNKRIPGWQQVHRRLTFDENGVPMLYVTMNCPNLIRTLPELVHSETYPEDVDTKQEDHAADELRYVCMANPLKARIIVPLKAIPPFDPLNQNQKKPIIL